MAEGYLYDRGDELIERKDLSESLVPKITATTDQGKVLTVGTDDKAKWETPESEVPAVTPTTDRGKVLTVGSDDTLGWKTPGKEAVFHPATLGFSGGGGSVETKDFVSPTITINLSESGVKLSKLKEEIDAGKDVFLLLTRSGSGYSTVPEMILKCNFTNNAVSTCIFTYIHPGTAYTFYTNPVILHGETTGSSLTSGVIQSSLYHYVANAT